MNVGQLIKLHEEWTKHLPTVCPFYAVKCNNNPVILKILAALGTGFDCASKVRLCASELASFESFSGHSQSQLFNHKLELCGIRKLIATILYSTAWYNVLCPQNEIETVLNLGAAPDRIIYANPCKQISHLKFAADKGVETMTFDSEGELYKIKEHSPAARFVTVLSI